MSTKFNSDAMFGLVGIVAGLVGVGYAIGAHSKMAQIANKLDSSIDELASNTPVDIPNDMIERAVDIISISSSLMLFPPSILFHSFVMLLS